MKFWTRAACLAVLFLGCAIVYRDTLNLTFIAEDYFRINVSATSLERSWSDPLFLSAEETLSPRYRPVQFYTLALKYHLFGTRIFLYRVLCLVLLALVSALTYRFLRTVAAARAGPALAAAFVYVAHFSRIDVVHVVSAHFYLLGDLVFLIMLLVIFAPVPSRRNLVLLTLLLAVGLLTVQWVVLAVPVFFYRALWMGGAHAGEWRRASWKYAIALAIPIAGDAILEFNRSQGVQSLAVPPAQVAKNIVIATSHLFYKFTPLGFSDLLSSRPGVGELVSFVRENPQALAMAVISLAYLVCLILVVRRKDPMARFFCAGITVSVVMVAFYPGITPRYLGYELFFLCGLLAHLYSQDVAPAYWRTGALLFMALMTYNVLWMHPLEKAFRMREIRYVESLRNRLQSGEDTGTILLDGYDVIRDLKQFWRL